MIKSFCLLLASASLHRGTTFVLFMFVFAVGLLVRRTSPRAGRAVLGATVGAGLLLACFCVDAIVAPGAPRTAIVVTDKTSQAEEGRLVVAPRWGVVDRWHVVGTERHVREAREHLADPAERSQPLVLGAFGKTLRGRTFVVRGEYVVKDPASLSERDFDYAARAIALQMAFDVEQAQNDAPARTGMRLTAWQFEDLPSALYATIGVHDGAEEPAQNVFARDGWELVSHEAHAYALPADATPEEREAYARVREALSLWSRVDGTMECPFAPDPSELAMLEIPANR